MSWEGSTRNQKNPPGWAKLRRRVLERDGGICQVCGWPGANTVDHVVGLAAGGSHDESNLQAICGRCHNKKTARESAAARPRLARPPELHPGLLWPEPETKA